MIQFGLLQKGDSFTRENSDRIWVKQEHCSQYTHDPDSNAYSRDENRVTHQYAWIEFDEMVSPL